MGTVSHDLGVPFTTLVLVCLHINVVKAVSLQNSIILPTYPSFASLPLAKYIKY